MCLLPVHLGGAQGTVRDVYAHSRTHHCPSISLSLSAPVSLLWLRSPCHCCDVSIASTSDSHVSILVYNSDVSVLSPDNAHPHVRPLHLPPGRCVFPTQETSAVRDVDAGGAQGGRIGHGSQRVRGYVQEPGDWGSAGHGSAAIPRREG